ncbi:MAG: CRTAC1 family protein [Gemmataceae bacterium]|nr:CRTAC1 family protein [Gemmataceae bacterium]
MKFLRRPPVLVLLVALLVVVGVLGYGAFVTRPTSCQFPNDPPVRFTDVTAAAGLHFRHVNGATGRKLLPETMGSGVAVLDYDGDGRPDLFFVNGRAWPGEQGTGATQALYRNRGDGTFEDVTAAAGLAVALYGMGVAVGDVDNDGRSDLFVTAVGGNRLFRNVDGKRFEDVTAAAGLGPDQWPATSAEEFYRRSEPLSFPSSAAFLDYDGDGRLDLFVCEYVTWSPAHDLGVKAVLPGGKRAYVPPQQFTGAHCRLFRNVDGKRFEDVSAAAGVQVTDAGGPVGKALGVVVCDPDGDGWPDLVVANDTVRNFYFRNVPDPAGGRRFEEVGTAAGVAYADGRPHGGMGIDAGEVHPGVFAVLIANFSDEPNSLFRLDRANPVRFHDAAPATGLAGASRSPMKFGALFLDYDLDGRLDLFTCNGHLEPDIAAARPGETYPQPAQLFHNTGEYDRLFVPVSPEPAFPPIVGRGCAYLDYDGDGDLDLVTTENNGPARLLRNDSAAGSHFVRLRVVGDGVRVNRDAIGAVVTVEAGGAAQTRYVSPTRGYLSQSEVILTVGLGPATRVDRVTVRWPGPGGRVQVWENLTADATYRLAGAGPHANRL